MSKQIPQTKCSDVYELFFNPGEVAEIRAFGLSKANKAWEGWAGGTGIVYGYFDNAEAFGSAAEALDRAKAPGVYFTLNPVVPELLARANNRLKAAEAKSSSTTDKDILCIRWLPIDLDPVRPSGISSTDTELNSARKLAYRIMQWMETSFATPVDILAYSGNGIHLLYRLPDYPNTEENADNVRQSLHAIHNKFQNKKVEIDLSVFNPSRIWKLYGTTTRKGDHTSTRPHRRSFVCEDWQDQER